MIRRRRGGRGRGYHAGGARSATDRRSWRPVRGGRRAWHDRRSRGVLAWAGERSCGENSLPRTPRPRRYRLDHPKYPCRRHHKPLLAEITSLVRQIPAGQGPAGAFTRPRDSGYQADRRSTGSGRLSGPAAGDQLAVPAQDGGRLTSRPWRRQAGSSRMRRRSGRDRSSPSVGAAFAVGAQRAGGPGPVRPARGVVRVTSGEPADAARSVCGPG